MLGWPTIASGVAGLKCTCAVMGWLMSGRRDSEDARASQPSLLGDARKLPPQYPCDCEKGSGHVHCVHVAAICMAFIGKRLTTQMRHTSRSGSEKCAGKYVDVRAPT